MQMMCKKYLMVQLVAEKWDLQVDQLLLVASEDPAAGHDPGDNLEAVGCSVLPCRFCLFVLV